MNDVSILAIRIGVITTMLLTLLVLIWLLSGWKAQHDSRTGETLMRYNPPMRILGGVMLGLAILFPLFLIGLVLVVPPKEPWQYPAVAAFALLVAVGGVFVWREARQGCAIVSDDGILQRSPWFGTKFVAWEDVVKVRSYPNGLKIVYSRDGTKLRFPVYWTGMDALTAAMQRHVAASNLQENPLW